MMWGNTDDPVKAWRADSDRREQEFAQAREQSKRQQEQHERDVARAGASEEIAALKQRLAAVEQQLAGFDELAQAVATFGDAVDGKLRKLEELLTRHAELRQVDSRQSKGFQFARVPATLLARADEVIELMISSTLVTCCTGRSAGFSPLRMRPV
jgi:chromosome segregation ATPase